MEYDEGLDYQDRMEDQEEQQDDQESNYENQQRTGYDYPQPKESESLYNLFHKVLGLLDSSKVGNLDRIELGLLNMSVRDCQHIALLAERLGHPTFGKFFEDRAEIILSTSASKKGWFTELFVSSKKTNVRAQGALPPVRQDGKFK